MSVGCALYRCVLRKSWESSILTIRISNFRTQDMPFICQSVVRSHCWRTASTDCHGFKVYLARLWSSCLYIYYFCLSFALLRSRGTWLQYHVTRRPHRRLCPNLCKEHPSTWSSHPRWPPESRWPAAGGERGKLWSWYHTTELPVPHHRGASFMGLYLFLHLSLSLHFLLPGPHAVFSDMLPVWFSFADSLGFTETLGTKFVHLILSLVAHKSKRSNFKKCWFKKFDQYNSCHCLLTGSYITMI